MEKGITMGIGLAVLTLLVTSVSVNATPEFALDRNYHLPWTSGYSTILKWNLTVHHGDNVSVTFTNYSGFTKNGNGNSLYSDYEFIAAPPGGQWVDIGNTNDWTVSRTGGGAVHYQTYDFNTSTVAWFWIIPSTNGTFILKTTTNPKRNNGNVYADLLVHIQPCTNTNYCPSNTNTTQSSPVTNTTPLPVTTLPTTYSNQITIGSIIGICTVLVMYTIKRVGLPKNIMQFRNSLIEQIHPVRKMHTEKKDIYPIVQHFHGPVTIGGRKIKIVDSVVHDSTITTERIKE